MISLLLLLLAQEVAVPTTPVVATIKSYSIVGFSLEREPDYKFTITYKDSNGKIYTDEHIGPSSLPNPTGGAAIINPMGAEAFIKQINTMNFSITSMMRRLLQHLVIHGKIPASTISGEADK